MRPQLYAETLGEYIPKAGRDKQLGVCGVFPGRLFQDTP